MKVGPGQTPQKIEVHHFQKPRLWPPLSIVIMLFLFGIVMPSQAQTVRQPVEIEDQEVIRFWQSRDIWKTEFKGSPKSIAQVLEEHYFAPASPGLKTFIPGRIDSSGELAKAILADESYYEKIRSTSLQLKANASQLEDACRALRQIFPQAVLPRVYLVIGRRLSGGTSTPAGLVIGAEMFASSVNSRLHPEDFVSLATHELIHYQQARNGRHLKEGDTLLRIVMAEGAADFISEYLTGHHIDESLKTYGDAH